MFFIRFIQGFLIFLDLYLINLKSTKHKDSYIFICSPFVIYETIRKGVCFKKYDAPPKIEINIVLMVLFFS